MSLSSTRINVVRCAVLVTFLLATAYRAVGQRCKVTYEIQRVEISGRSLHVELYKPSDGQRHPLILILHDAAGVYSIRGNEPPSPSNYGEESLARDCFVVAMPHYFELVGAYSVLDVSRLREIFPDVRGALEQLIRIEENLPETRGQPVGIYGISYGGFLAVSLAASNARISAISVVGAGSPEDFAATPAKLPPLLLHHGDVDTIVSLSEAERLRSRWEQSGGAVKFSVLHGEGHYLSAESRSEIFKETRIWFARFLTDGISATNAKDKGTIGRP